MKEKKYRTYTKEFKREALELLANSNKSAAQLERELGIPSVRYANTTGLLLKWRDRYQVKEQNGEPQLSPSDLEEARAEIRRLRRELLANSNKSAAQLERELGITTGLLLKWRDRYQVKEQNGEPQLSPSDLEEARAEIRRLRRELFIAEQERDILKKQ